MNHIHFLDDHGTFSMRNPENTSYLYFPLASETGLKSSVTPNLGGDAKLDQETFLLEPVSSENLHNNRSTRNFWFTLSDGSVFSAAGSSAQQEAAKFTSAQDDSEIIAGFMWQTLTRRSHSLPLETSITSFIPRDCNVEIMYVTVKNLSADPLQLTPYAAIPLYGRSADNIRDHRNVTSMLHRIRTTRQGVLVRPTMSFDERGHNVNHLTYYTIGCSGDSVLPESFFPTVDAFLGEGGTYTHPRSVYEQMEGVPAETTDAGKEAMGAFRFPTVTLDSGATTSYIVLTGVEEQEETIHKLFETYNTSEKVLTALSETREYWKKKVNVSFHSNEPDFDSFLKWVSFQPFLRRIFGCSFLPYHDYGRGGRGWRDLWQDCLSLLLMDPDAVGEMIAKNYGGVRVDGTNATIIGSGDGNFIADRNGIARVWMDHALWPLITTSLYLDQTGDFDLLLKEAPYFKDAQICRGSDTDTLWDPAQGSRLYAAEGESSYLYTGTILEHILIQQLTAFFDVGEHNIYRMHGADWNDALDMAAERGESVAFTYAYAGNLRTLAAILRQLQTRTGYTQVELLESIALLMGRSTDTYEDITAKREILSHYTDTCRHTVSGKKLQISLTDLIQDLEQKADWLTGFLRRTQWLQITSSEGWFNSYYDNSGNAVDGFHQDQIRMMLTGQVFSIMGKAASPEQIRQITAGADHHLFRREIGGYRLNTDFCELKFDMGRMFGFAYGEKENGAVFSHMTVMFANALYQRGFAKEGWKALKTLAEVSLDFDTSKIYPGIPEYFRSDGRGMYHYLTGAASWYLLTMLTEVYGVRGCAGDLMLTPKLLAEQFDENGLASVSASFAGKKFNIHYENISGLEYGSYRVLSASCDSQPIEIPDETCAVLSRKKIHMLSEDDTHEIRIVLAADK